MRSEDGRRERGQGISAQFPFVVLVVAKLLCASSLYRTSHHEYWEHRHLPLLLQAEGGNSFCHC